MTAQRRQFPTDKQKLAQDDLREQIQRVRDAHVAKYGQHECTPDPSDPWSTCHLESTGAGS